jgi:ligand-binding sensor domain-containing protein
MRKHILIVLLLLPMLDLLAQVPFFQHYELQRRNEQVQVYSMVQGKRGFIWIGTAHGLFRFDGVHYVHYTTKDSLADDHVTALAVDSLGRIWIGYRNGKISYQDHGVFKNFEPREGTSSSTISDMLFDRKGNLWYATLNDGLYQFKNNRVYRFDEAEGMPDLYVYDITEDSAGNILAGTDGGVAIVSAQDNKTNIRVLNYKDSLPDNIIKKFAFGSDNTIWMATEDSGVINYNPQSGKITKIVDQWSFGTVSDILIKDNQLWIACPHKGLLVYDENSKEIQQYSHEQAAGTMAINVLLKDIEGNIWAGSKTGLLRTPGNNIQFISALNPETAGNILAVTPDLQNNIWYSGKEGLFKRSTDSSGKVTHTKILAKTPYEKLTVISLYADSQGYIWAGLYGEGVLRIDSKTLKPKLLNPELRNGNVLNVTGKGNVVWLATLGGASRITITGEDLAIENFGRGEGLSSDFIYQIFIDSKDRVWFSTDGKGVDMLDKKTFTHFEEGLPSKIVYGITEDSKGRIWANIQGNGLYVLNDRNIFQASTALLRENEIHVLASDKDGNLVVMHDTGIDIIDVDRLQVRSLADEAGLRDKVANLNALSKDAAGNLFFGTSAGIIRFENSREYLKHSPIPIISTVKIFDQPTDLASIANLRYFENNLTFNYVGLWFQSPENIFFSYKLENYDRDWIATRNTSVTYSRLPPGNYVFKVKVSTTENFGDARETQVAFEVTPPFWKTPPFYMGSIVLLIISVYVFIRFRERKLIQDKALLEARVRRRTLEVQRQNDEIQAQNEEIMAQAEEIKGINENLELMVQERTTELERKNKALEEYAFINAHKLRSPVASILGLVNLLSRTRLEDEGIEINKRLKQSAEELDDIVRSITKAIEKGEKQFPF